MAEGMGINPEKVNEIIIKVVSTGETIANSSNRVKFECFDVISKNWYNNIAVTIMPQHLKAWNELSSEISRSLNSLKDALLLALNTWEASNKGSVSTQHIAKDIPTEIITCEFYNNMNGYEGIEVNEVKKAVNNLSIIKDEMRGNLERLKLAAEIEGFRGGVMQANLNNVVDRLIDTINRTADNIFESISSNTGIAISNAQEAIAVTENAFTISD